MQEAEDLVTILRLLERHGLDGQHRIVQYLVSKVGLMPTLVRDYERDRKAMQRMSGTLSGTECPGQDGAPPHPVVNALGSRASKTPKALTAEGLSKAKGLLKAADFEFLQACPEPFRTAWLSDADWWLSLRDGYPKVDLQVEASKNMAHVTGKFSPAQIARLNLRERFRRWVAKCDGWRQQREERQAIRR